MVDLIYAGIFARYMILRVQHSDVQLHRAGSLVVDRKTWSLGRFSFLNMCIDTYIRVLTNLLLLLGEIEMLCCDFGVLQDQTIHVAKTLIRCSPS